MMEMTEEEYKQSLLETYQGDISTAVNCLNRAFEGNMMELETARHIAARIWCDPEYQHIEMDGDLAEKIAVMLMDNANGKAWNTRTPPEEEE
jgi:hypothetical protein